MIDDEIWNDVLEPYATDANRAFILAQILFCLKQTLDSPKGKASVSHTLELAIEKLYSYTEHHRASFQLFQIALVGNLKSEHEPTLILRNLV